MNWTDFDPYEQLMDNTHNVNQLIRAFNSHGQTIETLLNTVKHQQEIIEQLQHTDRRLQKQIRLLEHRLNSSP